MITAMLNKYKMEENCVTFLNENKKTMKIKLKIQNDKHDMSSTMKVKKIALSSNDDKNDKKANTKL